jgi:3-hydroxyisobutyrate dehydrogenase-like beta-hydroxyacid dehydrogenase
MAHRTNAPNVGLLGFGEAARAIVEGWGEHRSWAVRTYDLKLDDPLQSSLLRDHAETADVGCLRDPGELLRATEVVFCLVTADQAAAAAEAAAPFIRPGTLWFDGNSCAPGTKRRAAAAIESAGGRYVDLAIMAPIRPKLHRTPMLISGDHAEQAIATLESFDMTARIAGAAIGAASAIKMVRSVMIKGMEALTAECLLAARRAGVEEQVLASFEASDAGMAWRQRSYYNLGRMQEHGIRRAAEMREVTTTLRELGVPDRMSAATADWQEQIGRMDIAELSPELNAALDRVLAGLVR